MKKLLISALVAAMVLGFGATAFAAATETGAAFSDIAGNDAEFALTALAALGIYSGDAGLGGAVKPDDPITRAQFCKVIVAAMGRGSTAAGLAGLQPTFSDGASIPTWAWGSVNVAVYMGIINGYADGSFGPNNNVTYAEAVTMLIRAVSGHAAAVGSGIWPYNFLFYGVDNGFTGGVDVGFANMPATRGDVAEMLFATMQINKLNAKGEELADDPATEADEDTAILDNDGTGARVFTGILTTFDAAGNTCSFGPLADKVYLAGATQAASLLNVDVIAVTNGDDEVVAVGKNEDAKSVTGVFADWDSNDTTDFIVLKDGTKVAYDEPDWTLNGDAQGDIAIDDELSGLVAGDELIITVNAEGEAAFVFATRFETTDFIVADGVEKSGVDEDDEPYDTDITGNSLDFTIPAACPVTVNGAAASRDSLADWDVFDAALNDADEAVALRVYRQVVEGTVTGTSTTFTSTGSVDRITIKLADGTSKTYAVNADGSIVLPDPDAKPTVKYGLDGAGQLFVAIDYETLSPYAVCLSYVENGDGTYEATFDVRGQEVTYKLDDDSLPYCCDYTDTGDGTAAWAEVAEKQGYVRLEVDTSSNTVISAESWTLDLHCCFYQVLAVDAVNGTLTLDEYGEGIMFLDDPDTVVYKDQADGVHKTYIGLEALKAGDWLYACACGGGGWSVGCGPVFELTTDTPETID